MKTIWQFTALLSITIVFIFASSPALSASTNPSVEQTEAAIIEEIAHLYRNGVAAYGQRDYQTARNKLSDSQALAQEAAPHLSDPQRLDKIRQETSRYLTL